MEPSTKFKFATALSLWSAVLLFCAQQSYGQNLRDPRLHPFGGIRAAAARPMAAPGGQLTTAAPPQEAQGKFISFDAPGSCTIATFPGCTAALAINPLGEILGYSVDANGAPHGFLRESNGAFTSFDVPGAQFYTLVQQFVGPPGTSLNVEGDATGGYFDANGLPHGFVRDRHGAITTFDAPGAVNGTIPFSISALGEITGFFYDAKFFGHGFIREANGHITEFDAPGAGSVTTACFLGLTYPQGINALGQITGQYYDPQCNVHGFLRDRNGAFTVIDVPNSADTFPTAINDLGEITGNVVGAAAGNAFVRDWFGRYTVVEVPGVRDFGPLDINLFGVVVGSYLDANLVSHSFLWIPGVALKMIDFPGAGTGQLDGTYATSISPLGEVTGTYITNGVFHGFLFLP